VLDQALKLSSENLEVIALLGRAMAASGQREDALRMLDEAAIANRGKRGRPLAYVHREISNLQVEEGRLRDAVESMTKALDFGSAQRSFGHAVGRGWPWTQRITTPHPAPSARWP